MKREDLVFIDCSDYLGQDYPLLTTNMYVKCFNGSCGMIERTDGHTFYLGGIKLSKMDIKKYSVLSPREQAIKWWDGLPIFIYKVYSEKYFGQHWSVLSEEQIEEIWRKEHEVFVNKALKGESYNFGDKQQVDFELLYKTFQDCTKGERIACNKEIQNLSLFVDMMSHSSSFAHKAHKELNKLMK